MYNGRIRLELVLAMVLVLVYSAVRCEAEEVSGSQIREQVEAVLSAELSSLPSDIQELRQRAQDWLVLEVDRIYWKDEQLTWEICRRRKMTPVERGEALRALDGVLLYALTTGASDEDNRVMLREKGEEIANRSRLSILVQPSISELTHDQIKRAIIRGLKSPTAKKKLAPLWESYEQPDLDARFFASPATLEDGVVTWTLMRRANAARWQPRGGGQKNDLKEIIREFLKLAFGEIVDPDLGVPILDREDAASLPLRIEVTQNMMGGGGGNMMSTGPGMAGTPLVRSSASRGAVRRTINKLRYSPISRERGWPPKEDWMRRHQEVIDGPPELIVDTGGFAGSVVNKLAFSPDGRLLAAAGDVVRIWDMQDGRLAHTLRGQRSWGGVGGCTDLAFTPDGRQLLVSAAGFERGLRVYDVAAPELIREVHDGHEGHIERMALSRDGKYLVTYGTDRRLQVWDWTTREITATYNANESIDHLSFPTERPNVLMITGSGHYHWMRVTDGNRIDNQAREQLERRISSATAWPYGGRPHPFDIDFQWTHDRWLVAGYGFEDDEDQYWCAYWPTQQAEPKTVYEHKYYVTSCTLSPDGQWAASADALGNVAVWDTSSGETRHEFSSSVAPIYGVQYDEDKGHLVFGRTPYTGGQWRWNHYGSLDHRFDLRRRLVEPCEESEPPLPITSQNGLTLSVESGRSGTIEIVTANEEGKKLARLPFTGSSRLQPLCHSFLRGRPLGFADAVILGTEEGTLVALDPQTLLSRRAFLGHTDRVWCASQPADDTLLVSSGGDGTVRFWRLDPPKDWGNLAVLADEDGKVHHVFPGTPTADEIRKDDLLLDMNGKSISALQQQFSATGDWKYRSGDTVNVQIQRGKSTLTRQVTLSRTGDVTRPLLSLFVTADAKDWILWTPEGYYDASPNGHRLVGWHVNRGVDNAADYFPVEQFREKYHRPEVIDAVLRGQGRTSGLAQTDSEPKPPSPVLSETIVDRCPQVRIVAPTGDVMTGEAELEVVAEITTPKEFPVTSVSVLVNGKAITAKGLEVEGMEPSASSVTIPRHSHPRQRFRIRRIVGLSGGTNEICVVASNAVAHGRSSNVWVTYRRSVAPSQKRNLYVLAVGISDYGNDKFDLEFAAEDARAFASICEKQAPRFYEAVETRVICDGDAVENTIEKGMDWLATNVQEDDVGILMLSGHGVMDDRQNFYFATHDVDPQSLRSTCLRWTSVHDLASDLRGTFILFADTCHAGGIAGIKTIIGDPVSELSREDIGTVVFASCGSRAVSLENKKWGHGAFTKALLDTLGASDSDRDNPSDGRLSFSELEQNLDRRVLRLTDQQQRPISVKPNPLPDLDLFVLP